MKKRGFYLAFGVGLVAGTANAQGETQPIFIAEAPVTVPPSGVLMTQPPAPVAMPPSGVLMTQPFPTSRFDRATISPQHSADR
jgi:hypothetical protein